MKYSLIFPGQGAQRPEMGKAFYDKYQVSRSVFEEADDALGFSLSGIIFNGTQQDLMQTAITQPAILTVSMAVYRAVEYELGHPLSPCCAAGHSLGEYTSHVAAGTISLADGVRLVHLRGSLMQDAVPAGVGAMAAIIGLEMARVKEICREAAQGEVCEAANINAPTQIVISGHTGAVARASEIVESDGVSKAILLRVSAPFHCGLMRPVGDKLKAAFGEMEWNTPKFPIVTNFSATASTDIETLKDALYMQTFSPVLWLQSVLEMERLHTDGYVELGTGSVLSGLVRKICRGKRPHPVSVPEELENALNFLRGENA